MSELGLMCIVALDAPVGLVAGSVIEALRDRAPRSTVAVETCAAGTGEASLSVEIDRQSFAVASFPDRMPIEIETAVRQSGILWPGRHAALDRHSAFISISAAERCAGHGLVRAQAVALTRLTAALAATTPALGACWPSASAAVDVERLANAVAAIPNDIWPVDLWIGYTLIGAEQGGTRLVGARSHGAADYFGSEIEIAPLPVADQVEPLRIILNLAGHLMAHGAHVRDRQPIQVLGDRQMFVERHLAGPRGAGTIRIVEELSEAG